MKKLEIWLGILSFLTLGIHFVLKNNGFAIEGIGSLVIFEIFATAFAVVASVKLFDMLFSATWKRKVFNFINVIISWASIVFLIVYSFHY